MTNIVKFEDSNNLPAYLQSNNVAADNSDITANASKSFPVMSVRGKVFTYVKDGEEKVIMNPNDPDSPANWIPVVIVKANPHKSKTYYANAWNPDAEDTKPTCFSTDGVHPDPSSSQPQCKTCAACKWNQFGTARSSDGTTGKGKACSDHIRLALAATTNLTEPFLMRIPPASIKSYGEYGKVLTKRGLPYQAVVTKIAFDPKEATPRLKFEPYGLLGSKAEFDKVREVAETEEVKLMLGVPGAEAAEAEVAVSDTTGITTRAADAMEKRVATAAVAEEVIRDVMDPKSEAKAAPAPKAEAKVVESLDDMLDGLEI